GHRRVGAMNGERPAWLDRGRRIAGVLALASFALHLSFAHRYGWFRDELYYVACGKRLAWGYVDHPPVVAVIARLAGPLLGDSLVGLRLFAGAAGAAAIVIAAELTRELGGGAFAQGLAAFAVAVAPYDLAVAQLYTMNAFEPVVWGAAGLVVVQ